MLNGTGHRVRADKVSLAHGAIGSGLTSASIPLEVDAGTHVRAYRPSAAIARSFHSSQLARRCW